ncbi:MAG: energy transducer TonB [Terriglobales bacterium]
MNPKVLKGDPILAHAALDAVRQWRYKPYYLDGEPVEIQTQITVNFKTN